MNVRHQSNFPATGAVILWEESGGAALAITGKCGSYHVTADGDLLGDTSAALAATRDALSAWLNAVGA